MRWVLERVSGGVRWRPASWTRSSSEGDVGGGEAFEEVAGAEGQAEPEAFGAGAGEEGAAGEAFGVDGVGEVEVADVADVLDVVEKKGDDAAAEIEEVDGAVADEAGEGQVAGEGFSGEAADDDLFVGGRHGLDVRGADCLADCRMADEAAAKKVQLR